MNHGVTGLVHSLVTTWEQNIGKSIICGLWSSSVEALPTFGATYILCCGGATYILCVLRMVPDLHLLDANRTLPSGHNNQGCLQNYTNCEPLV